MGVIEKLQEQVQQQAAVIQSLSGRLSELEEDLDEDIKGSAAAAKIAGVSVRTLEVERERPGTLIIYKKVGRSVSYSRASLKAYRKSKRIPTLKVAS